MKFIHTGDLHLSGVKQINSNRNFDIQKSQYAMLCNIAECARKNGAEAVLICGDVFDDVHVPKNIFDMFSGFVASLAPIKVYIIFGNHDYCCEENPVCRYPLPENAVVIKSDKIVKIPFDSRTYIYAASFCGKYQEKSLLDENVDVEKEKVNILMMHADLNVPDSLYNPVSTLQLQNSGMDYAALSHIHKSSGVKKAGNTYYAYSSIPQPRHFGETSDSFVIFCDVEKCRSDFQYIKVCDRSFNKYDINVNMSSTDEAAEKIRGMINDGGFYRFVLKGTADSGFNFNMLKNIIDSENVEMIDETTLFISDNISPNNLAGRFILNMQKKISSETDEKKKLLLNRALKIGVGALSKDGEVERYED